MACRHTGRMPLATTVRNRAARVLGGMGDADLALEDLALDRGVQSLVRARGRIPWEQILAPLPRGSVEWVKGWDQRGAPVMSPAGSMVHHTASVLPTAKRPYPARDVVVRGRSDVPGPLAHLYASAAGPLWVVASGRANHAGRGDVSQLTHMRADHVPLRRPNRDSGGSGGALVGIELDHPGVRRHPWPAHQIRTAVDAYALCHAWYGWTDRRAIAHHEWTRRKIDPVAVFTLEGGIVEFRQQLAARIPWARNALGK